MAYPGHCPAEAVGLEPTRGVAAACFQDRALIRPGWLPSVRRVPGAGIEPAASAFRARRHDQPQLPRSSSSGRRIRTSTLLLQRQVACRLADSRECPAGVEPACPAWGAGASTARPRARERSQRPGGRFQRADSKSQIPEAEGGGVEPPRLIARPCSRRLPSPVGSPFHSRSALGAGIEPAGSSLTERHMNQLMLPR